MKTIFQQAAITGAGVEKALDRAVGQVRRNLPDFTYRCQNHSSVNGVYPPCDNVQWTCGFWPGEIWLAYEHTQDPVLRHAGLIQVESFLHRIENKVEVDHHDMGFLYTPACVAAYKLTGSLRAKRAALLAADQLLTRFRPVGEFFQAWGALGAADNHRFIIDCLLNLPLLYWAGEMTGDERYRQAAARHFATCLNHSIRENGSTFHTVFMHPENGAFVRGATCQGYKDDSDWARGQAWAVYGTALGYRHTGAQAYRNAFGRVLEFYLCRLPADMVPYWDLIFTRGSEEPRDSSSAAIVACGLLEMASCVDGEEGERYRLLARQMVKSLAEGYSVREGGASNGLLLHGTYSKKSPYNTCTPEGVDECTAWGDYFYLEALTRLHREWEPYW